MDYLLCPSFSSYSSNNLNDVAQQVINENDHSYSQNDIDDFEFVAFQKTADEVFFDHRRNSARGVFPIFNRDDEKRNSVVAEDSIPLQKLINRDGDRRNSDAVDISISLRKVVTGYRNWNIDPPFIADGFSDEMQEKQFDRFVFELFIFQEMEASEFTPAK
ncbi:hypothetical protein RYX36_008459 [Vicia faba]